MSTKIKIAIVGVGNCASALVQGLEYYKNEDAENIPGIMFGNIGGYRPQDIEVVAAFDVDSRKVGTPLKEAIWAKPNCCRIFAPSAGNDVIVQKLPVMDGVAPHMLLADETIGYRLDESQVEVNLTDALKESGADVVINYAPVGSQKVTEYVAQSAIDSNTPMVNCIPQFIASNEVWAKKFIEAGLPLIGDDMKSQFGASIMSQMLNELIFSRGLNIDVHIQENKGGNTDFMNMTDKDRIVSKKISKENVLQAVYEQNDFEAPKGSYFAGPSNCVPWLGDKKVADFFIRAHGFGGAEYVFDAKLEVQDSENSAGVVIDAIRYLKVAQEMGISGPLLGASAFTQKSPPRQIPYNLALDECKALAHRELTEITKTQV